MSSSYKIISLFILLVLCFLACSTLFYNTSLPSWSNQTTDLSAYNYQFYLGYVASIAIYFFADTWLIIYPILACALILFYRPIIGLTQKKIIFLCVFLLLYCAAWESWYQQTFLFTATPGGLIGIQICRILTFLLDPKLIPIFFNQMLIAVIIFYSGIILTSYIKRKDLSV